MRYDKNLEEILELWIAVIKRAITDLSLYCPPHKNENEQDLFLSAYNFIFDDNHTIYIDNYWVQYYCDKCNNNKHELMSSFSCRYKCIECKSLINPEYIYYSEIMNLNKEMKVIELFEMLGVNDIKGFREKVKKQVKEKTSRNI